MSGADAQSDREAGGRSGWPRRLPGALTGDFDADRALDQVRSAIRIERHSTTRAVDLHIQDCRSLDPSQRLWRLRVALRPQGHRLTQWDGAMVWCDLEDGEIPWSAEVLEADIQHGWLIVQELFGGPPQLGAARARPIDFLAPVRTLLDNPRLNGALHPYRRLLGATLRALEAPTVQAEKGRGAGHAAWDQGWALVWGPPGTGKTHTLVEAVARLLEQPDTRVLVLSTTNRATDEIALRLGPRPGGVLRVGTVQVEAFRERGAMGVLPEPEARMDQLAEAQAALDGARSPRARARARLALAQARNGLPRLKDLLTDEQPRCVITTLHAGLSAAVSPEMDLFHLHGRAPFTTVVIDEAGLVPRATAALAGLLAAEQVVLVGDPKQLSPICVATRSMAPDVKRWLALSAMEGVRLASPNTQSLMNQRRMHPDISAVVSQFQYGGRLQDHLDVERRPLPASFGRLRAWPRAAWVVLDRCSGMDSASVAAERGDQRTWTRPGSIDLLDRLFTRTPELRRQQGLFISPYRGQARLAGELFKRHGIEGQWAASTVHAQQGNEADVVIFDLVCHGGWPADEWRRLVNVALSRARFQLLFLAASDELGQPWLDGLRAGLKACVLSREGAFSIEQDPSAQRSLFANSVDALSVAEAPGPGYETAPTDPGGPAAARSAESDPATLGAQVVQSRAARRSMTRAQAQLVHRSLRDLGPRLVRGVAGSGKTIVLARWAALELHEHGRRATVVYGNTALEPHLKDLLAQAWRVTQDDRTAELPWDRIDLVHIGTLLQSLQAEAGQPPTPESERFDLEAQARRLAPCGLPPRFELLYIDEAQDLGHETLGLLLSLVCRHRDAQGEDQVPVRIFYDNAQNVYRRSTPRWAEFGLDMRGRATVLRESFRATRPAMEFALDVLHQLRPLDQDPDLRELISPRSGPPLLVQRPDGGWRADFCVVQGQQPTVSLCGSRKAELEALVGTVTGWLAEGVAARDIRVLASTKRRCEEATQALLAAGIAADHARSSRFQPRAARVIVTTPQSFKGYEAELVAVIGVDGFCDASGNLLIEALYVALTRARTAMWVSATRVASDAPTAGLIEALDAAARLREARAD